MNLKNSNSSSIGKVQNSSTDSLKLNDRVQINNDPSRIGNVVYIGTTSFSNGEWIGIILDEPVGKNNGTVQGRSYFECPENHGVFARRNNLAIINSLRSHESNTSIASSNTNSTSLRLKSPTNSVSTPIKSGNNNASKVSNHSTSSSSKPSHQNFSDPKMNSTLQALIREKESHIEQLINERENERNELANLTMKNEELEKDFQDLQQSMNMLRNLVEEHEATIYTINGEKERLIGQVEEAKKNLEDMQFQMLEDNIERQENSKGDDKDDVRLFELEENLTNAKNNQEAAEKALQELRVKYDLLANKDSTEKDLKIEEYKIQVQSLMAKIETLEKPQENEDFTRLEKDKEALIAENAALKERLKSLSTSDQVDANELIELRKENETLRETVKEMQFKLDKVVDETSLEINQLKGQLSEIEAKFEFTSTQLEEERLDAAKTSKRTDEEFQQMVKDLHERENDLMDALSQIKNLEKLVADQQVNGSEEDSQKEIVSQLNERIEKLSQEIVSINESNKEKIDALTGEKESLQKRMSELEGNLLQNDKTKELDALKEEIKNLEEIKKEKDSCLSFLNEETSIEVGTDLLQSLHALMKLNSNKANEMDKMRNELNQLREELEKNKGLEEPQDVVDTLESHIKELKGKNAILEETLTATNKKKSEMESGYQSKIKELEERINLLPALNGIDPNEKITVDMLNKIISDLHSENARLKSLVPLESKPQAPLNAEVKEKTNGQPKLASSKISSRPFCDYCEVFDQHETENCPNSATINENDESFNSVNVRKASKVISNRLFCDICEVFDLHDTKDCPEEN